MTELPRQDEYSHPADRQRLLEEALLKLAKLLKAAGYYPARHPALAAAAEQARQSFTPLLTGNEVLSITVRKEGMLLQEQPVAASSPLLKKLSHHLFARRVQTLLLLPELTVRDLLSFARCLGLGLQAVHEHGGMAGILARARISTIWVNETDLALIHERRAELEAQKEQLPGGEKGLEEDLERLLETGGQDGEGERERDLETVLKALRGENSDPQYRLLLQELPPLIRTAQADGDHYLVLEALFLLHLDTIATEHSVLRRGLAGQALEQLFSEEICESLIDFLCTRGVAAEIRAQIFPLLAFYPEKTVRHLMDRLAREKDLLARRLLIEAIIRQGTPAAPILTEFLADPRWFVVRNAVSILGEIRDPSAAVLLPPLLHHRDVRVARESVRALTKIGGPRAVGILLSLVEGDDSSLGRQALLSLGAMKNREAIPTLLKLIGRPDPLGKRIELKKGAIKALGEIGAPEAVPALITLLKRRRFFGRGMFNTLRAAAAAALGEIGSPASLPALRDATEDRSEAVARAAGQSLKHLGKIKENGSGNI